MKRILFTLCAVFAVSTLSAQVVLTYDMLRCSRAEAKALKKMEPTAYVAQDGHTYNIGDKVVLGDPAGKHTTTVSNGGFALHSSTSSNYSTIVSDASIAAAVLGGVIVYMADRHGEYLTIKNIRVQLPRKNSVVGACVNISGTVSGVGGVKVYDFDKAIQIGEIRSEGMTREAAMARLRSAKEQLDLQIISQEEYDALKTEMMQYINK